MVARHINLVHSDIRMSVQEQKVFEPHTYPEQTTIGKAPADAFAQEVDTCYTLILVSSVHDDVCIDFQKEPGRAW
jgi:hypothetical protein